MSRAFLKVQHACGHLWRYPVQLPAELRHRLELRLTAERCPNCESGVTKPSGGLAPEAGMRVRGKTS